MSHLAPPALVEPAVRGLLGAIDVDGGPTPEQLAVLRAITTHLWSRPDVDPAAMSGADGPDVALFRTFVVDGRARASAGSLGRAYLAFYGRHHLSL